MITVAAVGGWMAAGGAGCVAAGLWRALGSTGERVARACHELRGPLTAVRLGLQLGAGTGELSPARLRALDLELGRAALALEDLGEARGLGVARPVGFARSTGFVRSLGFAGPPGAPRSPCRVARAPQPLDLEQLIADSVEAWRPAAAARGVALDASWSGCSGRMWGDRLRLAQAIGNLIANAIEHGGGVVEVRGRDDGDRVRIEVIDSGPGLPAPVATLARHPRGMRGRGLAIASAVAATHGGRLAAAPSERGARLVLEFPAGRVNAGGGEAPAGGEPPGAAS